MPILRHIGEIGVIHNKRVSKSRIGDACGLSRTDGLSMDILSPAHHSGNMSDPSTSVFDQIYGAQAPKALLAGNRESALNVLARASTRYVAEFLFRFGLLVPSILARLICELAHRRLSRLRSRFPNRPCVTRHLE